MSNTVGADILREVDAHSVATHETPKNERRGHFGFSIIGKACARALWYEFRWADHHTFSGRLLRLFQRGHSEEANFTALLRATGWTIHDTDPQNPGKQIRVVDYLGHLSGSLDGVGMHPVHTNGQWVNVEYKTHNTKQFSRVAMEGVKQAKPVHYGQMMCYTHKLDLSGALYCAVNKNDDALHFALLPPQPAVAEVLLKRAADIIDAQAPPKRINENPSFFECAVCDHKAICHGGANMDRNCRTCSHSKPVDGGAWFCQLHLGTIPRAFAPIGCEQHQSIKGD